MQNIALPKKIEFTTGATDQEGIITVEPLFPGYGMTLGNSLRRVLLSSLPGAAVIGVKIKGASHEFMALPQVKEDVLEIILNLKQLRLKIHTEEEVVLDLKVKGKKTVTAADIIKNSQAEIKNPNLVIAHITDEHGSLDMEITVKEGRGYKMAEGAKKDNRTIGYIEIDSVFSPVTLVSIDVENTRVGKMTNWDKLILNVKTDGTISPENAFNEAVKILVDQYTSFLPKNGQPTEAITGTDAEIIEAPLVSLDSEENEEMAGAKKEKKEKKEKVKKIKK
jgi:DNA-directed RNA polymerase subunit alpha